MEFAAGFSGSVIDGIGVGVGGGGPAAAAAIFVDVSRGILQRQKLVSLVWGFFGLGFLLLLLSYVFFFSSIWFATLN